MKIINWLTIIQWLKRHLPLLVVIATALIIAIQNINPNLHYAGWDNIHAEFDLVGYARQVIFGAWVEHQGLGAPAAQAQLADVFRLPILFVLNLLLPSNLVRYVFIFLMYLIGGIGMYLYLSKHWLASKTKLFKDWLASLGAVFYLLHVLTLQQFYISFEMFTVQFAFLPFLLLSTHNLIDKFNIKNIAWFILVQLLIAPSAHASTVFYVAVVFSLLYGFFTTLNKGFFKAFKTSFLVGLLTLAANAYWIVPNVYYMVAHSDYVEQSRENRLFAPEAVWSIREAGTITNLTSGTHYLFNWSDYDFETDEFNHIFNEWEDHLSKPPVALAVQALGVITLLGLCFVIPDKSKGNKRWGVVSMYLLCLMFIWIDLFPTHRLVDWLYQSGSFVEAFRNPFTKLSIVYSFVSILLFIQVIEWLVIKLKDNVLKKALLASLFLIIGYTAWPSFQGHFISEKLQITYPDQYQQLFSYLRTRDKNLRVLQLPQMSGVTWEYYDWSFIRPGNGYQGMGFYFFGFPQPFLNRDSDRWVETSDFFYHELKYALDNSDVERFKEIVEKYNVDLLIVDETKLDPNRSRDYALDHQLAIEAGFHQVWQQDFLTVYERVDEDTLGEYIIPFTIKFIATDVERVRVDTVFQEQGNYLLTNQLETNLWYPLADLTAHKLMDFKLIDSGAELSKQLPLQDYTLTLPGLKTAAYFTPVAITYQADTVTVLFPQTTLSLGDQQVILPKFNDFTFKVVNQAEELIVFFNNIGAIVKQGETAYPVIKASVGESITVDYVAKPAELLYLSSGEVDGSNLKGELVANIEPTWSAFQEDIVLQGNAEQLKVATTFPAFALNLLQNPSVNCATTERGEIETEIAADNVLYKADSFAVNCNGYVFEHLSPTYSYVMKVSGKNFLGRATKFFVSYSDDSIAPEVYIEQEPDFTSYITTARVSTDPTSLLYLNWETRSHGKQGINELDSIKVIPFPTEQLASLRLEKQHEESATTNLLTIKTEKTWLETIHLVNISCDNEICFLGIDQSYDDLWLALDTSNWQLLPHWRYNNWANMWQVTAEGTIIIFYLPSLIALASLTGLISGLIWLVYRLNR